MWRGYVRVRVSFGSCTGVDPQTIDPISAKYIDNIIIQSLLVSYNGPQIQFSQSLIDQSTTHANLSREAKKQRKAKARKQRSKEAKQQGRKATKEEEEGGGRGKKRGTACPGKGLTRMAKAIPASAGVVPPALGDPYRGS